MDWIISYRTLINDEWRVSEHRVTATSPGRAWSIFIINNSYGHNIYDILARDTEIIRYISESYGHMIEHIPRDGRQFKEFLDNNCIDISYIADECEHTSDEFYAYYVLTPSGPDKRTERGRVSDISIRAV